LTRYLFLGLAARASSQADSPDGFTLCHASRSGFAVTRCHSIVDRVVRIWPPPPAKLESWCR